jgi:hypothetical protein
MRQLRLSPGADDTELVHLADDVVRPPLSNHDAQQAAQPHTCRSGSGHNNDTTQWHSRQEPEGNSQQSPSYKLWFRNIVYSVKPRRRGSKRLTILDNVSGHCRSGRVLAVRDESSSKLLAC